MMYTGILQLDLKIFPISFFTLEQMIQNEPSMLKVSFDIEGSGSFRFCKRLLPRSHRVRRNIGLQPEPPPRGV